MIVENACHGPWVVPKYPAAPSAKHQVRHTATCKNVEHAVGPLSEGVLCVLGCVLTSHASPVGRGGRHEIYEIWLAQQRAARIAKDRNTWRMDEIMRVRSTP